MRGAKFFLSRRKSISTVLAFLALGMVLNGCSKNDKTVEEVSKQFDRGNYKDVILLSKRAISKNLDSGRLYYFYGLALLRTGSDYEAFEKLEKAVEFDGNLAPTIGNELLSEGRKYFREGGREHAASCLEEAVKINPDVQLDALSYLVADDYYDKGKYNEAVFFYRRALQLFPDTSIVERAYARLSNAYVHMGLNGKAEEICRYFLERFTKSYEVEHMKWQLARLLLGKGEKAISLGNYEQARDIAKELVELTTNVTLKQKGLLVMGEAFEGMGEYAIALKKYKEVVAIDQGTSGGAFKKARRKIEEYEQAGFRPRMEEHD